MNDISLNTILSKAKPMTGNIYGFRPSIDTFQGLRGKLDDIWSSTLQEFYILKKERIIFKFVWDRIQYATDLKRINETNFQGRIISDGEIAGSAYYTLYENKKGYLLRGTWDEDDYKYDSIIEIRKLIK